MIRIPRFGGEVIEVRHLARIVVDFEWLAEALGLPDGAIIRGVDSSRRLEAIEVKVEHESLPAVEEGTMIPAVYAVVGNGKVVDWEINES